MLLNTCTALEQDTTATQRPGSGYSLCTLKKKRTPDLVYKKIYHHHKYQTDNFYMQHTLSFIMLPSRPSSSETMRAKVSNLIFCFHQTHTTPLSLLKPYGKFDKPSAKGEKT